MKKDSKSQKKKAGYFNLFPLLAHVALTPRLLPWGPSAESKNYKGVVDTLLEEVPRGHVGGWYVWGAFNESAWFQPTYIGMSSPKDKAGLYQRLFDELTKQNLSIFAAVYGRDAVMTASREHNWKHEHNEKGVNFFKDGKGPQRDLRRTDARFVIWISTEDIKDEDKNFGNIESALIDKYRPSHNSKRPKLSKTFLENSSLQKEVRRICGEIEEQISSMSGDFRI